MSKGKYKRKREHAQHHAMGNAPQARLNKGEVVDTQKEKDRETAKTQRQDKEENPVISGERTKQYGTTDWLLAIFTGALVATSIYQFIIMRSQLDTMRKDQRP